MVSASVCHMLRTTITVVLFMAGFLVLFLMYYNSLGSQKCRPPPAAGARIAKQSDLHKLSTRLQTISPPSMETNKPILLLWFWASSKKFELPDCRMLFGIDSCHLTDNRSFTSKAQAVLIFHREIHDNLTNLPTTRTRLQRWIWCNMDSPTYTRRIAGIQGLFNLTLSYRSDADIHVGWKVTVRRNTDEDFILPKKERLLCWIVDSDDLHTATEEHYSYYRELVKHIKVDIFNSSSDNFRGENYFRTISSCKFYLSFENSIHKDYITETFNGPLAAGTVPIVLGPPRKNYENFAPGSSFIHVNDFPDAAALARYLQSIENDHKNYMKFFEWRQFFVARRHLTEEKHEFAYAVCQACHHVGMYKEYRVIPDLYKWFFQ